MSGFSEGKAVLIVRTRNLCSAIRNGYYMHTQDAQPEMFRSQLKFPQAKMHVNSDQQRERAGRREWIAAWGGEGSALIKSPERAGPSQWQGRLGGEPPPSPAASSFFLPSLQVEQLHVKDEGGIGRDDTGVARGSVCHIRGAGQLRPLPQAHLAGMGADGERRKRTQLDLKEKGKVTMAFP